MTKSSSEQQIRVIDSHTAGEPTRVVIEGGPDLGVGDLTAKRLVFRDQFDWFRSAVVNEPRGSDVIVGALLTPASNATSCAGVIYFNNVGVLNMCGHGTIGVAVTLARLGRIAVGAHRLDTPVGVVGFEYHGQGHVSIENVPSYLAREIDDLDVPGIGRVRGDIAWGGNWFFLSDSHGIELSLSNIERLLDYSKRVRCELQRREITGADGGEIDHIELTGPPRDPNNHGRNFVLCPGAAYDRSPCGTGTSAKLACLHAHGKLGVGEVWRQESIIGSVFSASYQLSDGRVIPRISGSAFVTAESTLVLDPGDPFRTGFSS